MSKILLVEDDAGVLTMQKELLTGMGFEVVTATDCDYAKDEFKANPDIDFVCTDWEYPYGGGHDLIKFLREQSFDKPILVVSANMGVVDAACQEFGGNIDGIRKPYSIKEFCTKARSTFVSPGRGGLVQQAKALSAAPK